MNRTLAIAALLAATVSAGAADINLTSGNSEVWVDPETGFGVMDWLVDGVDHLAQDWFWYRLDGQTEETPVDWLDQGPFSDDGSTATLNYGNDDFALELVISPGANSLTRTLTVTNLTGLPLSLSLFHYVDLDVDEEWDNNVAVVGPQVLQDGPLSQVATTSSLAFSHFQIGDYFDLSDLLLDTSLIALDDVGGPLFGDYAFILQFDLEIGAGQSESFSVTSVVVPEPASLALLGAGGLAIGLRRRRG